MCELLICSSSMEALVTITNAGEEGKHVRTSMWCALVARLLAGLIPKFLPNILLVALQKNGQSLVHYSDMWCQDLKDGRKGRWLYLASDKRNLATWLTFHVGDMVKVAGNPEFSRSTNLESKLIEFFCLGKLLAHSPFWESWTIHCP